MLRFVAFALTFFGAIFAQSCAGFIRSGIYYDFTSLRSTTDYVIINKTSANPSMINFNFCGPVVSQGTPACNAASWGCQHWDYPNYQHQASLGMANTMQVDAFSSEGGDINGFILFFTGGSSQGNPITSQITLNCAQNTSGPVLISKTGGLFIFSMDTPAGCPLSVDNCEGNIDGVFYNLSSINQETTITTNGLDITVNPCSASTLNTECPSGSVACTMDQNGQIKSIANLDTMNVSFIKSGECEIEGLLISYEGDDDVTTNMNLICAQGNSGPVLVYSSSSLYEFAWNTDAVCDLQRPRMSKIQAMSTFQHIDKDGDGMISEIDFVQFFMRSK